MTSKKEWPPPARLWERMIVNGLTGEVTFLPEDYVSPSGNRKRDAEVPTIPPFVVIPTAESTRMHEDAQSERRTNGDNPETPSGEE